MSSFKPFTLTLIAFILSSLLFAHSNGDDTCVYTIYVQTRNTSTDGVGGSAMSLSFADRWFNRFETKDLVSWGGLMGPNHAYFQKGKLDIFTGRGNCLSDDIRYFNYKAPNTNWRGQYIEIFSAGIDKPCKKLNLYIINGQMRAQGNVISDSPRRLGKGDSY